MSLIINPDHNHPNQHILKSSFIIFYLLVSLIEAVSDNVSKRFVIILMKCMTVSWVCVCVCEVPEEARLGHQMPWNYR